MMRQFWRQSAVTTAKSSRKTPLCAGALSGKMTYARFSRLPGKNERGARRFSGYQAMTGTSELAKISQASPRNRQQQERDSPARKDCKHAPEQRRSHVEQDRRDPKRRIHSEALVRIIAPVLC